MCLVLNCLPTKSSSCINLSSKSGKIQHSLSSTSPLSSKSLLVALLWRAKVMFGSYLQSPASGPFIQQPQVSYEQSLICVSCLLSGLNVFQQGHDENDRFRRVLRGLHGLHLYANEYWTQHLLTAASYGAGLHSLPNLLELTETLCKSLQSRRMTSPELTPPPGSGSKLDTRLTTLEMYPPVYEYIKFELTCRLNSKAANGF